MGIIRNFIDIIGVTPEDQLAKLLQGQQLHTLQQEHFLIAEDLDIKNIYQIIIDLEILSKRLIKTPLNNSYVIDGLKKIKVLYYDLDNKVGVFEFKRPFNLLANIEDKEAYVSEINVYLGDAYFQLLNRYEVYGSFLFIIDINYFNDRPKFLNASSPNNHTEIVSVKTINDQTKENMLTDNNPDDADSKKSHETFKEIGISHEGLDELTSNKPKVINSIDIDEEYL